MRYPGTGCEWSKNWAKAISEWWVIYEGHEEGFLQNVMGICTMILFNKWLSIPYTCIDPLVRNGRDTRVQCHVYVPQKTSDRQIASARLRWTKQVSKENEKIYIINLTTSSRFISFVTSRVVCPFRGARNWKSVFCHKRSVHIIRTWNKLFQFFCFLRHLATRTLI